MLILRFSLSPLDVRSKELKTSSFTLMLNLSLLLLSPRHTTFQLTHVCLSFCQNKNRRSVLSSKGQRHQLLQLTASDFGVQLLGRDEMQRRREEVDAKLEDTIGYHSVKQFLADIREKVLCIEAGGDRREMMVNLNVVVTGAPGVGKSTFGEYGLCLSVVR